MSYRAPWPHNHAAGPRETLPHRTPGATQPGLAEPAGRPVLVEYIRLDGPGLVGETELPPPPEVLDRVLDGLRKLS